MTTELLPRAATAGRPLARGPVRPMYAVAGLVLLSTAVWGSLAAGTGLTSVLLFALLPDVALLLALTGEHEPGQLPRAAVPAYNLLHHPLVPITIAAAAAAGLRVYWLVAATTWAAHIALDRAAGYGLRTKDGWQRG